MSKSKNKDISKEEKQNKITKKTIFLYDKILCRRR